MNMDLKSGFRNVDPRLKRAILWGASVLLPFFLLSYACIFMGVTPFGEHSFAISDGSYYLNILVKFGRILRGEESALYSFQNGLGGNMWSGLAWGWFNIPAFLAVNSNMESISQLFTWIVVLNLTLAGAFAYPLFVYLRGHRISNLIFSTSYALIGFSVVNCYHFIFFQGIQLLPLMVLGLIKLCRGENPLLYILSLAVCIFSNFYFGFMLCVASVLLFAAVNYVKWDELRPVRVRLFVRYAVSSLIAGLLASPMWLTAVKAYSGGGRMDQTTAQEFTFSENMPFIQIFSKLFTGANSTSEIVNGLPNIFCGILMVALVILFFTDKTVEKKKKQAAGALLIFYLLSFYITAFTLAMHGFSHTNWFPYRYSFVFSFLLIGIAAEELSRLPYRRFDHLKHCFLIIIVVTILVFAARYEFVSGGLVVFDLTLLLLAGLGFRFWEKHHLHFSRRVYSLLLLVLVCVNLFANFMISVKKMQVKGWELDLQAYRSNTVMSGGLLQGLQEWDKGFYRVEKDDPDSGGSGMDSYLYNYNGISHSGPTERDFIHRELCRLGITFYSMNHVYYHGVPAATDALLGLKYVLSGNDYTGEKSYELIQPAEKNSIYLNPNALSYAVLCDEIDPGFVLSDDAFENLNTLWKQMSGGDRDIYTPVKDIRFTLHNMISDQTVTSEELRAAAEEVAEMKEETGRINYTFTADTDGTYYRYNTAIASGYGSDKPVTRICGRYDAGETAEGFIEIYGGNATGEQFRTYCSGLVFAYEDQDVLSDYAAELNSRPITFHHVKDTRLTGEFTAKAGQRILFTIPWDEGWTCTIDGKKVPIDKTWGLFMSVEAPAGTHTYEMKFFPAWLDYSLYISAASFAALVVFMLVWKRSRRAAEAMPQTETQNTTVKE